jgi:hypothetical protein
MPVIFLNTVTRTIHIRILTRQIHNTRTLPTAVVTLPARLRRSLPAAALLFSSPPLHAWRWWRGRGYWRADGFLANLKMVDADPSSPATMMSRPPQVTSRRGSDPSDHHENNYFIRDRG